MTEEIKKEIEEEKAKAQEGLNRLEELGKEIPESLPKPEEQKKIEDKRNISPLNRMLSTLGLKKESPKGEGKDWTRVKSSVD